MEKSDQGAVCCTDSAESKLLIVLEKIVHDASGLSCGLVLTLRLQIKFGAKPLSL
jgi:hypothetical protein